MDQAHRQIFEKIAQDSGSPEATAPGFVVGLSPQEEWLIRKRTAAASKLRHLPPELAYALTGEMPITESPEVNIELQRALERATSRGRSKLVGLGYGLPAAAAGAVLGHVLSGGDPYATAGGGLAAGGGVGYLAHRGEREGQRRLAAQLANLRTRYQVAQEQAMLQQQQALQELAQAQAMEQRARMVRRRGQRKAAEDVSQKEGQANFNEAAMARFRRRAKKGLPKMGGLMSGVMDDKPHFDASDPGRFYNPDRPWTAERDKEEVSAEAPTYIGRFGGERYGSLDETLRAQVAEVLSQMRSMEKEGVQTGNLMAPTGAGAMKPPSPSGGGMGAAAQAPRLTASPTAAGMAPKQPSGVSIQTAEVKSQPKPKTYNLGPASNMASGAPPAVSQPPSHAASPLPTGFPSVMPSGVTPQ